MDMKREAEGWGDGGEGTKPKTTTNLKTSYINTFENSDSTYSKIFTLYSLMPEYQEEEGI